jgi:hypothetical protein
MLKGFIDTLRRMAAEAAAAQIFGEKGSGGLGDLFRIGLGAVVNGGGSGSTVPSTEPFAAAPPYTMASISERSSIAPSGGSSKITVAPVYNIDARGATQDFIKALPAVLEANSRRTVDMARAAVMDDLSRRGQLRV